MLAFCLYGLLLLCLNFLKLKKNWMHVTFNGRTEIFQVSIKIYKFVFSKLWMT